MRTMSVSRTNTTLGGGFSQPEWMTSVRRANVSNVHSPSATAAATPTIIASPAASAVSVVQRPRGVGEAGANRVNEEDIGLSLQAVAGDGGERRAVAFAEDSQQTDIKGGGDGGPAADDRSHSKAPATPASADGSGSITAGQ